MESYTTRIGSGQNRTFISGIYGTTVGVEALSVVIDQTGRLGTFNSSRRFKDDIADMDSASAALMQLRPVMFRYKTDASPAGRSLRYGLIAEEVQEVYPELVAHSADGQIQSVLYQYLPPMLLNEYQKQQRALAAQETLIATQSAETTRQAARIAELEKDLRSRSAQHDVLRLQQQVQQARLDLLELRLASPSPTAPTTR